MFLILGVVERKDVDYAKAWMHDLKALRIPLPKMVDTPPWTRNAQLCIMFNTARYAANTTSELLSKHFPLFKKIVVILDSKSLPNGEKLGKKDFEMKLTPDELPYSRNWPPEVSAYACNSTWGKCGGFLQNRCLLTCLKTAAEDGTERDLFYMGDDDYFNYTQAEVSFPKDKIWFSPIEHIKGNLSSEDIFKKYKWAHIDDLKKAMQVLEKLPDGLKDGYMTHVRLTKEVEANARADCIYVPKRYQQPLKKVIEEIEKLDADLYSEAGMPLAVNLVAPGDLKYKFQPNVAQLPGGIQRFNKSMLYKKLRENFHVHTVKLSYPGMRAVWRDVFAEQYKALLNIRGSK